MRSTLRQLDLCFPAERRAALGVRWNEPDGGFFLTMRVPFRADNAALARSARGFRRHLDTDVVLLSRTAAATTASGCPSATCPRPTSSKALPGWPGFIEAESQGLSRSIGKVN